LIKDKDKTKEQLINEMRQGITELEVSGAERKTAKESLGKSEAELRSILLSMADLVFVLDKEGRFTSFHIPSEELYLSPEEFVGKRVVPPSFM